MLDQVIKTIINDSISEINTTMQCRVVNLSPLQLQPVGFRQFANGDVQYPLIVTAKRLYGVTLQLNDLVLVAFGKDNLTDAVVLGVIV